MTEPQPASTAALTLSLFGPMQVLVEGRPLPRLRSRKSLWLLALLALRQGRPVEREWLAGTLWPDSDQDRALASLRPALSELRRALGGKVGALQSPTHRTLCLGLTGATVDVLDFDAALTHGTLPTLVQAVSLYRGPLLEGCAEEWVGQERTRREQDCLRALQTLADAALAAEDWGAAAAYAQRAAALDPWRDAVRRSLMAALVGGGEVNAALSVYREYVALLRDDPRAAPDAQTTVLYERLRAGLRRRARGPALPEAAEPEVSGSLPYALTDLVGREDEREDVAALLRQSRLVTLTGPGGIGKTRLALAVAQEVADEFADGVCLVALETLSDGARLPSLIAGVLGVKEETGRTHLEALADHLRTERLLLVLDNCEHVLLECAGAAEYLLRACGRLRILATSRERLAVTGEAAWPVPGLAVPDPAHLPTGGPTLVRALSGYEGVRLFVDRAQAVQKDFTLTRDNAQAVAKICARLGGIPLALELAAARVRAMTVGQMAARLDDHLGLLTGGSRAAPPRHQTLRATLDWSHALLSVPEQLLLARLSVFAGGWSLEAAPAVCGGRGIDPSHTLDLLTSLVDRSLVRYEEHSGVGRYRLLEMVRQYARERLGAEADLILAGHRDFFLVLAENAGPQLRGTEQEARLQCLDVERDNLRAALEWRETDAQAGLRLAGALLLFWSTRGDFAEGRAHLRRALGRQGADAATPARGRALKGAAALADRQGDYAPARALFAEALCIFRVLDDRKYIASTLGDLGDVAARQGDDTGAQLFYAEARALYEESLNRRSEPSDIPIRRQEINNLAILAHRRGDHAGAQTLFERSLGLCREQGDRAGSAAELNNLGYLAYHRADYAGARTLFEQSLSLYRELGDRLGSTMPLGNLGLVACRQGDYISAREYSRDSLGIFRERGDRARSATGLEGMAAVLLAQSEARRPETQKAVRLWGAARALRDSLGVPLPPADQEEYECRIAYARASLGADVFAAAWAEGLVMTWEQALAYALEDRERETASAGGFSRRPWE